MLPNRDQRSVSHPPNPLFLLSLTVEPLSPIKPPQQPFSLCKSHPYPREFAKSARIIFSDTTEQQSVRLVLRHRDFLLRNWDCRQNGLSTQRDIHVRSNRAR